MTLAEYDAISALAEVWIAEADTLLEPGRGICLFHASQLLGVLRRSDTCPAPALPAHSSAPPPGAE